MGLLDALLGLMVWLESKQMTFELTTTLGDTVKTFETFEAAEAHATVLLGVNRPHKTGPHVEEDGHTFHAYYMSEAHARLVAADKTEGGLQIHAFEDDEA